MKTTRKTLVGIVSLVLAFLGLSLLVGPFLKVVDSQELSLKDHVAYGSSGLLSIVISMFLWIKATGKSSTGH